MFRKHLLTISLIVLTITAFGQITNSDTQTESTEPVQSFFSQVSSGYAGTTPKVTANSYHLGFYLGKEGRNYWDLYLFNSVPTIVPSEDDTVEYVSNDIKKQLGGILNFSLGKLAYFGYGGDQSLRDIKGFQTDFRFGVKLVDTPIRRAGDDFLIPIVQTSFDFRYLIPLIPPRKATDGTNKVDLRKSMVGNLAFRLSGSYLYVINTTVYDLYYTTKTGILPEKQVLVLTPEMHLYITNQVYFSVGYYYNNTDHLNNNVFFTVSYGKPKN